MRSIDRLLTYFLTKTWRGLTEMVSRRIESVALLAYLAGEQWTRRTLPSCLVRRNTETLGERRSTAAATPTETYTVARHRSTQEQRDGEAREGRKPPE